MAQVPVSATVRKYAIDIDRASDAVLAVLRERGVILESDKSFPSVAGMVVGGPVRGSWWAHPLCHEIFMVRQQLMHHRDVLILKLIRGKLTYVHRRLWPEFYAIVTARESWQLQALPATPRALLEKVTKRGIVRMDELRTRRTLKELGLDTRTLESRLLVFGDDVHTESGAHVKRIETWEHWAKRAGFAPGESPPPERARAEFDRIVEEMNSEFAAKATLPWQQPPKRRRQ